jgi:type VI protein secretion system component VasA|tara:strand:- start:246 stop:662 length:417 start_codon:yes stop_codon:yes gene_type:complete
MRKKKTYSKRVKALKRQCDDLWAKIVKVRAGGLCEICEQEGSDSHHHEGRGLNVRWDLDNGIFLCKSHHTFGRIAAHCTAHSGQVEFHKLLIEKYGSEFLDGLACKSRQTKKWNLSELEKLKGHLREEMRKLEYGHLI